MRFKCLLLLFCCVGFGLFAWQAEAAKDDTQYWMTESATFKIAEHWKLGLEEEMYFQDNSSDLYYQHTQLEAYYSGLAKWLDVGLGYRHVLQEDAKTEWRREERILLNTVVKFKAGGWSFSDRNRFEYRIKENAEDFWRYRNKFEAKSPWELTFLKVRPYAADEFFVDLNLEEFNENRLYTGFLIPVGDHLTIDIYHLWRRLKSGSSWLTHHIVGTRFKLSF